MSASKGQAGSLSLRLAPCILPLALLLATLSVLGAEIAWPDKFYNPAPTPPDQPSDLILPLPCGGAMAFRPVEIPGGGWLDDRPVELGHSDAERGYKEGRRLSHLAGAFTTKGGATRRYYLGKYEVTRDQYAALMEPDCPKPNMRGRLPMTGASWFEAVDLTRRYTEWLLGEAPDALPKEDRASGFLRLPTEEEWEFAARGGLAVDAADFLAPRFPMPEGDLARYAWYESSGSAEGVLHPVGLLKPNPLGLHDILGNASELTLTPFHLDRRGRDHGQAGGFVSRGGDLLTPDSQLGSAVRQEHNYFDPGTGRAKTMDSLGFRLVVTAPVIVSPERLDAIKQSWTGLPQLGGEVGTDATLALQQLQELSIQTQDDAVRARLEIIQRNMEQSQSAINEARARTLRALLRTGAFMGKRVVTDAQRAEVIRSLQKLAKSRFEELSEGAKGVAGGDALVDEARSSLATKQVKWDEALREIETSLANSLSYYGDMTVGVGVDYTESEAEAQLPVVEAELQAKNNIYLIPYARLFVAHLRAYRGDQAVDKARWREDLMRIDPANQP
ncbi:hypothetical protein Thivi_3426 [Thiocystis violascens DSM 198]|uniref:Sulfatase-modifying factor enzyme-like domain-containing protein n=1 Tax=Thiocystis violascens (strain ATCC 17096 / DSM 198 / 6111) TaxID=765911 RepID=I3YE78_THIV6|nr:hypothetical protein Thivi_3426 [Thiocystis violascens DSM 198]